MENRLREGQELWEPASAANPAFLRGSLSLPQHLNKDAYTIWHNQGGPGDSQGTRVLWFRSPWDYDMGLAMYTEISPGTGIGQQQGEAALRPSLSRHGSGSADLLPPPLRKQ